MKVALLEVSHWHVPLYLDALEAPGIQVVAVSDAEDVKGEAIAARFGSRLYASAYELLEREEVDFAFVFGRHSEMPTLAEAVIARNIPFALEKPCGVNMSQVSRLRTLTEKANLYCAVPLIRSSSSGWASCLCPTSSWREFGVPVSVYGRICWIRSSAWRCVALGVVTMSKVGASGPAPGVRQGLRTMLPSSAISVQKLCAGVPSSRVWLATLSRACCERCAGATGSRVVLAAWSVSANISSRQASRMCHST